MRDLTQLFNDVYEKGNLYGVDRALQPDPLRNTNGVRPYSVAIQGGAFGDEGKGKIVDEICHRWGRLSGNVVVYRWNGGANAGHTVVVGGKKIVLHQLPSGVLTENATVVLGKGMALHPGDLVTEIREAEALAGGKLPAALKIDAQAVLAVDTHRAYEQALREWHHGGAGATGRGIAPAYADVIYRHALRMEDLIAIDWADRCNAHYDFYHTLIAGLEAVKPADERVPLAEYQVAVLRNGKTEKIMVGTRAEFLEKLAGHRSVLFSYIQDVHGFIRETWLESKRPYVFEGAQGVGLDPRFGVYPDVTGSDTTFSGIQSSTEGIVQPEMIAVRASAIKATYTSSVGVRRLPTQMEEAAAKRIRDDAQEYGATTGRPRDIAAIDIPCLRFFCKVTRATHLVLTHLDIAYADTPIPVCTHYTPKDAGRTAQLSYRPDQSFLDSVQPHYINLPAWDGKAVSTAREISQLPYAALQYIAFLTTALGAQPLMGTTGPDRDALVNWVTW